MARSAEDGTATPGSEVLVAAADDSRYSDRRTRRLGMLYLTRGKEGGESAVACGKESVGIGAGTGAPLLIGAQARPPASDPCPVKRKKLNGDEKAAEPRWAAADRDTARLLGGGSGDDRGTSPLQDRGGRQRPTGDKRAAPREDLRICFAFARYGREACKERGRNAHAHRCRFCLGTHRGGEHGRSRKRGDDTPSPPLTPVPKDEQARAITARRQRRPVPPAH